jgi:hypothetical protein
MHRHIYHLVLTHAALTTGLPIDQITGCPGERCRTNTEQGCRNQCAASRGRYDSTIEAISSAVALFRLRPDAVLFPRTVRFNMDAISPELMVYT